jgi:hypothetical protein
MAQKRATPKPKASPNRAVKAQAMTVHLVTQPVSNSPEWDAFWQMLDALVFEQIAAESPAA